MNLNDVQRARKAGLRIFQRAVIGDGRNDENVIIAQIHLIFLMAHNKLFDQALADAGVTPGDATAQEKLAAFEEARRTLIDHWQAIVLDDYLTEHLSRQEIDDLRDGQMVFYTQGDGTPYCTSKPGAMPHEFAIGAFRHGHSQVRAGYLLNVSRVPPAGAGFGQLFGDKVIGIDRAVDFRGFFNGVEQHDPNAGPMQTASTMKIDTVLSPPLAQLMAPSVPKSHVGHSELGDLAKRNSLRVGDGPIEVSPGNVGLEPVAVISGVDAAQAMGMNALTDAEVAGLGLDNVPEIQQAFPNGLKAADLPLWHYVLAEAEIRHAGARLGDVGGTIIAETLVGLIACDQAGILAGGATFSPTMVPSTGLQEDGRYLFADLVNFTLGD